MAFLYVILVVEFIQLSSAAGDPPSDPQPWPNQFTQKFKETFYYPVIGTHTTTGKHIVPVYMFNMLFLL